jgi:K+-sensing histidine kinase KdpD
MGLIPQTKSHPVFQSAVHSLLGVAAVLLLTYAGYRLRLDFATTAFLCLIVVVLVSLGGRFIPAAIVSVVAVLALNYFFVAPPFRVRVAYPLDAVTTTAFLATALVISRLTARLRQSLDEVQALSEQLRLVVDTIPTMVARTQPDGSVDFVNQRWLEYLGSR